MELWKTCRSKAIIVSGPWNVTAEWEFMEYLPIPLPYLTVGETEVERRSQSHPRIYCQEVLRGVGSAGGIASCVDFQLLKSILEFDFNLLFFLEWWGEN